MEQFQRGGGGGRRTRTRHRHRLRRRPRHGTLRQLLGQMFRNAERRTSLGSFAGSRGSALIGHRSQQELELFYQHGLSDPRRILQGFDILPNGEIYYSQVGSNAYTLNICRAAGPNQNAQDEVMILKHFGHGTQIVAEKASDGKTYIWLNSNASVDDSGEYGNNWSFSRVEFVPGTNEADGYAGDTFFLNKEQQYDQQVAVDFDARRLLVGSRKSGVRHFWIFDLDEVLALPLKEMTVSVTVGGGTGDGEKQTVERKIMGHDLNDCLVLLRYRQGARRLLLFASGTRNQRRLHLFLRRKCRREFG